MSRRRTKETKIRKFTNKMQASLLLVFCVVVVFFLGLIGRIFYLNQKDGERYTKQVLSQQSYSQSTIPYKRGDIVDRNGTVLAKSVKVYNLILDPVIILEKTSEEQKYKEPTINALVEAFDFERADLEQVISEKETSRYVVYEKGISYEQVQQFKEVQSENKYIQGVWFEDDYVRTYPYNSLASKVIGFTFSGNVGNSGIEGYYNEKLNGTNGSTYGYYDANNNVDKVVKPATNGYNVVSTIDLNVQQIVEQHIATFEEEIGSKNTAVIVADPNTGEILAMATNHNYDLNNPRDLSAYYTQEEIDAMDADTKQSAWNKMWRNFCISDTFEPGSTIKPMTVAAALEESLVHNDQHFLCDGGQVIGGKRIRCAKRTGHGDITLEEVLAFSCNDGIMQISEQMGKTTFAKYQDLFNLGRRTGIDLAGETSGIVYREENLGPTELATSSFGQSMSLSMVQVLASFSSVINGGYYYVPHVVKQITNESGAVIENVKEDYLKQVISNETSELVRNYMLQTVERGTAQKAKVAGYEIAGKTGTAQKLPREDENYLVSFIGYAPASDPKVVVYVVVDEPNKEKVEKQSDSGIACSLAAKIMEDIFPFVNVDPTVEVEDGEDVPTTDDNQSPNEGEGTTTEEGSKPGETPTPTPSTNDSVYDPSGDDNVFFESDQDSPLPPVATEDSQDDVTNP